MERAYSIRERWVKSPYSIRNNSKTTDSHVRSHSCRPTAAYMWNVPRSVDRGPNGTTWLVCGGVIPPFLEETVNLFLPTHWAIPFTPVWFEPLQKVKKIVQKVTPESVWNFSLLQNAISCIHDLLPYPMADLWNICNKRGVGKSHHNIYWKLQISAPHYTRKTLGSSITTQHYTRYK